MSLTEDLAIRAYYGQQPAIDVIDQLADEFVDDIVSLDLEPTDSELELLRDAVVGVFEELADDADELVNGWREDANDFISERMEAQNGRY